MAKIGGHPDKPAQNVQKIKANLCREEIATSTATVFWKLRKLKRSQMVSACFIHTHVLHACQREPAENHLGNLLPNVPDPWPHRLHSWKVLHSLGYSQNVFFLMSHLCRTLTCQPANLRTSHACWPRYLQVHFVVHSIFIECIYPCMQAFVSLH